MVRPFAADQGWQRLGVPGAATQPGGPPGPELPGPDAPTQVLLAVSLQIQAQQNDLLAAILQELREWVPQGVVTSLTLRIVATTPPQDITFDPRLFTLSITNDGGSIIQYRVPNRSNADWIALNPTEVITVNFPKGLIPSAGFRLAAAGAANVRLVGTY